MDKLVNTIVEIGENNEMSVKDLKMKLICLMAFTSMLQPSCAECISRSSISVIKERRKLRVKYCKISSKTDKKKLRKWCEVPSSISPKLNIVSCMAVYLKRSEAPLDQGPLFVKLKAPYREIKRETISKQLKKFCIQAELLKMSARCFRQETCLEKIEKIERRDGSNLSSY